MTSIELNPDIVFSIIDRIRNFQNDPGPDWEKPVDPAAFAEQNNFGATLADSIYRELETGIDDLEPDQQMVLVALVWVGRGDFDASQWDKAHALAQQRWTEHTADYLIGTPLLADYLEEALSQLGYTRE